MLTIALALLRYLRAWLRAHHELGLENIALRHQPTVLQRQVRQPRLKGRDRVFWVVLKRAWPDWRSALMILQPETIIAWQRAGFRMFWRWKSRRRRGRPAKDPELVHLIRQMWVANPTWGSPRIRDELGKLGLDASTATIRKYRPHTRRRPSQGWRTFLCNHARAIAALDFFVVPTVTGRLLYVLVVLTHERRKVVHFNITQAPTAEWTAQQVINAFPDDTAPRYLLRDRDSIYEAAFCRRVEGMGITQKPIAPRSPWQSPYVERLIELPLVGGLHHHYLRQAA